VDPRFYGGVDPERVHCRCKNEDPECERPGPGEDCLVCVTEESCGSATDVQLSISFFKITNVDLRTSEMDASVWVRQIWTDPRLAFDYQCYGGQEYFEIHASAGSLGDSRIWTPDLELSVPPRAPILNQAPEFIELVDKLSQTIRETTVLTNFERILHEHILIMG
jgi:hypothetical protein